MYTQCPQCQTFFQVTAEHLKIAHGNVRCGQCRNVFSALGNLSEQLPDADDYHPNTSHFDSHQDSHEDIETDFLTDEELEELEGFDTNIYDEEDDFFENYSSSVPARRVEHIDPVIDTDEDVDEIDNTNLSKAIAAINELNKRSEEKLQKLNAGKKAIEDKYGDQLAEAMSPAAVKARASKASANASKPAAIPASPARETASVKDLRQSVEQKPDIPVQRSEQIVDLDEAMQAIDELDINDRSADFVASVAEEYAEQRGPASTAKPAPAPQQPPAPKPEPAPAKQQPKQTPVPNPAPATQQSQQPPAPAPKPKEPAPQQPQQPRPKAKANLADTGSKPPPAKSRKKKSKPAKQGHVSIDSIDPDIIPVLPAILMEEFEKAAAPREFSRTTISWSVGSVLLMLFFLFQTVYFKHDQLAQVSALRPWMKTFCTFFDCEVSLQFDKNKLELMAQDIRSHPKVKKALLVSTTIINNARYQQAYPGLQITFSNLNGQKIAMRRFLPSEYMPPNKSLKQGMPPDTPINVEIELMDPGDGAVNFEFAFFKAS